MPGLTRFLVEHKVGDPVIIDIDPSQVKGMPHRRFQGLVGRVEVVGRRSVVLAVRVGGKMKRVVARFEHVKPQARGQTG